MVATLRLGVVLAAAAIVAAGPVVPVVARGPALAPADVEIWLAAAVTHEPGLADDALVQVMGWPRERIDRILQTALLKPDLTRVWHALSLHTDIAIVERTVNASAGAGGDVAIEVLDGRQSRVVARSFHWTVARAIATALARLPGQLSRVAAWYRAVGAMQQEWLDCDLLADHLQSAHKVVGTDPHLALYQATLHQTYADPRLQRYAARTLAGLEPAAVAAMRQRGGISGELTTGDLSRGRVGGRMLDLPRPASIPSLPRAAKVELDDAERWLRRALALDPTLVEARIRLAHVLSASGEHAQAVEMLRPVDPTTLPRFSAFYTAMVLGRSEEHLEHYAEAGAAYARAAALFPGGQSVEIGRSRVALAQGRTADALTTVVAVAGPGSTERDDPWTSYFKLHDPDAQTLLQAWRAGLK